MRTPPDRLTEDLVVPVNGLGDDLLTCWRELHSRPGSTKSPFLHPSFALLVERYRPLTRVGVHVEDGRPRAFFPHERRRGGRLLPLAAGLSDAQGLVMEPGCRVDMAALLRTCGGRVWEFDHLLAEQAHVLECLPHHVDPDQSPMLDLQDGFDTWRRQRRSFNEYERKARKLGREVGGVDFEFDSHDHDALEQVMAWKSAQYRRTGRRDRFAVAANRGLVHDLLDTREEGFGGVLSLLRAGEALVAGHIGMRSERTLSWWFPAYDPALGRYSPGSVLLLETARAAAAHGVTSIDLGRGDEAYKRSFANAALPLLRGRAAISPAALSAHNALHRPSEYLTSVVLRSPRLRSHARDALRLAGGVRASVSQTVTGRVS